jgi:hypothetical protein
MRTVGIFLASCLVAAGCASRVPFDPALENRAFYLCCNLRFNQDHDATDANYAYPDTGITLPLGTRVRVTRVYAMSVRLRPEGDPNTYSLELRFGRNRISARQYFLNILRDEDPRGALVKVPPEIADAIRQGRLVAGMTKEQALMARGYPPLHRTESIAANDWIFYETRGFVDRVTFVDGKIQSVTRAPAPE